MEPLIKTNLSESLARILVEQIKNGLYAAGSRLPTEKDLMEKYNVGRSSVREAFQSLAILGVIESHPGQGTFVKDISKNTIINPHIFTPLVGPETTLDFLEARLLIEPSIAGLAALRHAEDNYDEMHTLLERCGILIDEGKSVTMLNGEFHLLIAKASKNLVFLRFIESIIRMLAALGESLENDRNYLKWELSSHRGVLSSIRSRDMSRAAASMEMHIKQVSEFHARIS